VSECDLYTHINVCQWTNSIPTVYFSSHHIWCVLLKLFYIFRSCVVCCEEATKSIAREREKKLVRRTTRKEESQKLSVSSLRSSVLIDISLKKSHGYTKKINFIFLS
jgi:hypothetical protein